MSRSHESQRHANACCPMHMIMMMGADRRGAQPQEGPTPSFADGTSSEPSAFCDGSDARTRDLYDIAEPGRPVVIRGSHVITMGSSGQLPDHDVIIVDGVIRALEPSGGALPDGCRQIDATGLFVIPGLSEMHTHPPLIELATMYGPMFGVDNPAQVSMPYDLLMFLYLAGGVTRLEVMFGTPEYLGLREHITAKRVRGPSMRIASPLLDGFPFSFGATITWGIGDPQGARKAAQQIAERGYDFAKPYTRLKKDCYWALVEECDALGIPVMGHIPTDVEVEQALRKGQRGVAHVFEYFCHEAQERKLDPDVIMRKAKLSAERGMVVQTTLVAGRALEYDVGLAPGTLDASQFLDPIYRLIMADDSPFLQGWRDDPVMVHAGRDCFQASIEMTKALVAEGVTVLPGTDFPPNLTGLLSSQDELQVYVQEVGMTPQEALRASTITSALHQGEGAIAGTLEPGKRSDLVILEADPTTDINHTRLINGVMIGNAFLNRHALDRGIERAKSIYDAMPVQKLAAA